MFGRKKKSGDIFADMPVFQRVNQEHPSASKRAAKHGRRAMLVPDIKPNANVGADQIYANTAKQREEWFQLIFDSPVREEKVTAITKWLVDEHRMHRWWANSIALSFMAWRDSAKTTAVSDKKVLRATYELPIENARAFKIFAQEALYGKDEIRRFLKQSANDKLVIAFDDGTRATLVFEPSAEKLAHTDLNIEHEFIVSPAAYRARDKYWGELLFEVIERVQN